jgi:hypothetical protein
MRDLCRIASGHWTETVSARQARIRCVNECEADRLILGEGRQIVKLHS